MKPWAPPTFDDKAISRADGIIGNRPNGSDGEAGIFMQDVPLTGSGAVRHL